MIAFLGDIHGDAHSLRARVRDAYERGATALVQVGDFGVYPSTMADLMDVAEASPIPIYFIDGNHEDYRMIAAFPSSEPKELSAGLTYVPRGVVVDIGGVRIGFLGGAGSIDYSYRTAGRDWWPSEEQVKDFEVDRLIESGPVDVLVTHTPPRSLIDRFFDTSPIAAANARRMFGAAPDWTDRSADKVQRAWDALGRPQLYCGHMHRTIMHEGFHLLGIGELAVYNNVHPVSVRADGGENA